MITYFSLFPVSMAAALAIVYCIATHRFPRRFVLLLAAAAFVVVAAAAMLLSYFQLRVQINGHYEVNGQLLIWFALAPVAAGICTAVVSALMYAGLRRRESAI